MGKCFFGKCLRLYRERVVFDTHLLGELAFAINIITGTLHLGSSWGSWSCASSSSPSTTDKTTPLAMRLGLLPEVAALDADGDIAEGLEPVFVNGIQTPFWQSHVRWFRWFASGDAALLLVLLLLKEIA